MIRNLRPTLTALLAIPAAGSLCQAQVAPPKPVEAFLANHCYDCHDDSVSKGGLNLLDLAFDPAEHANFKKWERVFDRVRTGEMPPEKKPRPAEDAQAAFLRSLREPLLEADRKDRLENGRVQVRRLTRREYEHTVHDLIGTDLPLMAQLPEDPATHGFETVAAGQQLSHHHLGRYLEAADLALDDAFGRLKNGDVKFSRTLGSRDLTKRAGGNFRGPEERDGLSVAWPIRLQFYGRMPATSVPASGWYRVTLKDVHAVNPKNGVVWGTLRSGECASNAPILYPVGIVEATAKKRDLTFEAWIQRGHMLELKPNDATLKNAPTGATGGNVGYNGRDHAKSGFAGIAVSGIRIDRIYPNATAEELRANLLLGLTEPEIASLREKKDDAVLEKAIARFASRAFRRPVADDQIAPYLGLARETLRQPDAGPMDALRSAYRAILCSTRFLTFVEPPGRLDDHALATRLGYALWNSMPDEKLRALADEGKLGDWKVFNAEVGRLLDDPRSERFIAAFTDQWLNLKEIDFTSPDTRLYRSFDDIVQASMVRETRQFVREIVATNAPVTHLVESDFAMLNERLARFYGMDKVAVKPGGGVQKVALAGNARSGLITQGAVLKVTANGTTTSPVVRGVWVAERILGLEVPPPPANVPAIEPDIRGAVSIRDQLGKHRDNEACASCHRMIDPAGFALENFDPVGLWRDQYGTQRNAARVDPSGVTPTGEPFDDILGWKKIYLGKPDMLAEGFARQLLTYATGAPPRFGDRESIAKIVARAGEMDYGVRALIHTVLASELFKSK